MHNLYALERNSWKTRARDKRKIKAQYIETDYLAPDTAEEIISALSQLETWMKQAGVSFDNVFFSGHHKPGKLPLIEDAPVPAKGLERQRRGQVILKPRHAWAAYRQMLLYYAMKTIVGFLEEDPELSYNSFVNQMEKESENNGGRIREWVNLGGQIAPAFRVDELREKIRQGEIESWKGIHAYYDEMAAAYPLDRVSHAWETCRYLKGVPESADHPYKKPGALKDELETFILINHFIAEQVFKTREKDYTDPFRTMTYRNSKEMEQVLGNVKENSFIKLANEKAIKAEESVKNLLKRLGL